MMIRFFVSYHIWRYIIYLDFLNCWWERYVTCASLLGGRGQNDEWRNQSARCSLTCTHLIIGACLKWRTDRPLEDKRPDISKPADKNQNAHSSWFERQTLTQEPRWTCGVRRAAAVSLDKRKLYAHKPSSGGKKATLTSLRFFRSVFIVSRGWWCQEQLCVLCL